jgi:hypothetical protein
MEISSPTEPVYYYECSAGDFRLTYFIPPEELDRLIAAGGISARVKQDLPDGVDLDCTEPDFAEFERLYGFRPQEDPSQLLAAFLAVLSSTKNWRRFRGTGLIPKKDLVKHLKPVVEKLETEGVVPVRPVPAPAGLPLGQRRRMMVRQRRSKSRATRTLEKMDVKGIDAKRDISQQGFSKVKWSKGKPAAEVFDALNRQQKRG